MSESYPNAGPRLDRLPIARFHWRVLWLVAGGMFLDGFEIFLGAGVVGAIAASGWATLDQCGYFVSATFVGMVLGAWLAGLLGDRYGRRFSYQANLLIFAVASLAGAIAPDMMWLIVARFFMGIGLGAEIVAGYVTLSEFIPPKRRGRWAAGLAAIANSSLLAASLLAYLIIPSFGWRWMFILVAIGAAVVWYLRAALPESPRWLESKGRYEQANRLLETIESDIGSTHAISAVTAVSEPTEGQRPFSALFSKELIRHTLVGGFILIVINAAIYGFIVWIPTFMTESGVDIVSSLGFTVLMSVGGPLGALLGMWSGDRIGRKAGILIFTAWAAIFGAIYPYVEAPIWVSLVGLGLVTPIYALVAFAFAIYIPELFPTDLRMRGAGICNAAGRLMMIVTPMFIVFLFSNYGLSGVVMFMEVGLLAQIVVVAAFGIETRNRSLEALSLRSVDGELNKGIDATVQPHDVSHRRIP